MPEQEPPQRRLHLTLSLDSDNLRAVADALYDISNHLLVEGSEERNYMSAGYRSSYTLTLAVTDPEMDGDRYRAELSEWARQRREARDA